MERSGSVLDSNLGVTGLSLNEVLLCAYEQDTLSSAKYWLKRVDLSRYD